MTGYIIITDTRIDLNLFQIIILIMPETTKIKITIKIETDILGIIETKETIKMVIIIIEEKKELIR